MLLKSIVKEIFVDQHDHILKFLTRYDLVEILNKLVDNVDEQIKDKIISSISISSISTSFLTNINARLSEIKNPEDKKELEYLLSDISIHLMKKMLNHSNLSPDEFLLGVEEALQTTCKLYGWDFNTLSRILRLELTTAVANKSVEVKSEKNPESNVQSYFYLWNVKLEKLDDLAADLKSENCIKNVRNFKMLFRPHKRPIKVSINRDSLSLIIVIFDILKRKGLITPKGNKGHFMPIKTHCVDFEGKKLIEKQPKQYLASIKRNPDKYKKLKDKAENWIQS